jgi:hypothetical protein
LLALTAHFSPVAVLTPSASAQTTKPNI